LCTARLDGLEQRAIVIADKAYDADHIRALIRGQGAIPNIPNKSNRKKRDRCYSERKYSRLDFGCFFKSLSCHMSLFFNSPCGFDCAAASS
jgi:transposase